jgi:hypothetical protein
MAMMVVMAMVPLLNWVGHCWRAGSLVMLLLLMLLLLQVAEQMVWSTVGLELNSLSRHAPVSHKEKKHRAGRRDLPQVRRL